MSKAEKQHLSKVAALGCIVCKRNGFEDTPATIHHIRNGQGRGQRASDFETIPLCPIHHQTGDGTPQFDNQIAFHKSPEEFECRYGTERELLAQTLKEIGV